MDHKCKKCRSSLSATAKFCPECGTATSFSNPAAKKASALQKKHYYWFGGMALASIAVGFTYYYLGFAAPAEGRQVWAQTAQHFAGDGHDHGTDDVHNHPPIPSKVPEEALRNAAAAVEADPGNAVSNTNMGNLLFDSEKYTEAIPYYEKSLTITPNNSDVIVDLGVCYYNTSNFTKAEYYFKQALGNDPAHVNALYNLGIVSLQNSNIDQLKQAWGELIKVAPESQQATRAMQYLQKLHQEVQEFQGETDSD